MSQALPFRAAYTVVLNGSGNGTIRWSPSQGSWLVQQCAATVTTSTNEPEFSTFIDGMFVGGSYSGSKTNDTTFNQTVVAQQALSATWTGGDPGATATLIISGVKTV